MPWCCDKAAAMRDSVDHYVSTVYDFAFNWKEL
jgi:hypothetical protein